MNNQTLMSPPTPQGEGAIVNGQKVVLPGFYYHFKRQPGDPINYRAYEVFGVAICNEDDCQVSFDTVVIYRALYNFNIKGQRAGLLCRRLDRWLYPAFKDGLQVQRYQRILDDEVICALGKARELMYGV